MTRANDARLNSGDKGPKKRSRIRELISIDTRISLFQTSMNCAGRNFLGKRVKVDKMAKFASAFYRLSIKEIEGIGKLSIKQIEATFKKEPVKKKTAKASTRKLMNKIHKKNGKNKKKTTKKKRGKK